ncbi:MAG TPA: phosphoribosylamine--glycine ligase [Terriglobales bacterium]|nr:phosphoribosylamine--glycine ligase [Terriglobales bacterium]
MNVLILGGGGREHALAWKLKQSPRLEKIWCAPGNGGIAEVAECLPVDLGDVQAMAQLAARLKPDLTVVGPELPLTVGVVDEFERRGWKIFGPRQQAARLESSKGFAKEFMLRHRIPTAHFAICASEKDVKEALARLHAPVVVKADGLAAGKGVVIAQTKEEAARVAAGMLSGEMLGEAGRTVVLEEFLQGDELSFLVMSDGERVAPLAAARDHKRIGEGDTGPNTGGMGAYSTESMVDPVLREWLLTHIARPVVAGMKAEDAEYRGILYCGLMITPRGPMVLEFNCRFGDPETQPILMRLESDLFEAIEAAVEGRTSEGDFRWSADPAVCVVMAARGYPGKPETGQKISGLERAAAIEGVEVFHAGTVRKADGIYTSGGRVLGVTARGAGLKAAVECAYAAVGEISFDGMQFRRDIAAKAIQNL